MVYRSEQITKWNINYIKLTVKYTEQLSQWVKQQHNGHVFKEIFFSLGSVKGLVYDNSIRNLSIYIKKKNTKRNI